jgi:hypothetical protein
MRHGEGIIQNINGSSYIGLWENGKRVENYEKNTKTK